jgi:hypothetical protein
MAFVRATAGVASKGKVEQFCTIRLRDNGNAYLTMSRGFVQRYFPSASASDRFSVQWGTDGDAGKAMIARLESGDLRGTDLRGALALSCSRPPHAPHGSRPSTACRIISQTNGAVLLELPVWVRVKA